VACAELALMSDEAGLGSGGLVSQPANVNIIMQAHEINALFFIYSLLQNGMRYTNTLIMLKIGHVNNLI
jgi:hypothetical protein